ncbi:putative glucan endo-1,3-beta-glucosidase btgC [Exophiala dermatitidis]
MSYGRTFSFDAHDEHTLTPPAQAQPEYDPQYYQPYHDSSSRQNPSPPPRYASNSPQRPLAAGSPSPRRPIPPDTHLLGDPSYGPGRSYQQDYEDVPAPPPPPHRASPTRLSRADPGYSQPYQTYPGDDSRMEEFDDHHYSAGAHNLNHGMPPDHGYSGGGQNGLPPVPQSYSPYGQDHPRQTSPYRQQETPSRVQQSNPYGSSLAPAAGGVAATTMSGNPYSSMEPDSGLSGRSIPMEDYHSIASASHPESYPGNYQDSPYQNPFNNPVSSSSIMDQASINPHNIVDDDGDDGTMEGKPSSRQGGHSSFGSSAAGAGAVGGTAGALGGLFGRRAKNSTPSGTYGPVNAGPKPERSEWLSQQTKGKRKMTWVRVAIGIVIVLAIVGGIVGGVLGTRNSDGSGGSSGSSSSGDINNAASDTAANGDLGKDSKEIQALMNNKNLHKVFPGMDYTPWGTQYPLCFTYPPSQNNVTRDMAVLSQLTNTVRLYGTDCNQTEMVLHAIDRLELTDMKVWMGVWIDTNQTTTDRQIKQMYEILANTKDLSVFKGVIVGNEALYRAGEDKAQSEQELIDILTDVRSQFKTKGYDLPIATSDLGDNWNAQLVKVVDLVMSNIHPFFAGVTAEVAAGWTWDFWQNHDVVLTNGMANVKQVISETGWPSAGGMDCGGTDGSCSPGQSGAVASVDNMNTFMADWVCQALANGTDYFWFEAFDEPWKKSFYTDTQKWEDKWGLMDPGRKLKPGLQIPDCDGKTVGA